MLILPHVSSAKLSNIDRVLFVFLIHLTLYVLSYSKASLKRVMIYEFDMADFHTALPCQPVVLPC